MAVLRSSTNWPDIHSTLSTFGPKLSIQRFTEELFIEYCYIDIILNAGETQENNIQFFPSRIFTVAQDIGEQTGNLNIL